MMNLKLSAMSAIQEALADELSPVCLAQTYAQLMEELNRQLEVCMNSMFDEAREQGALDGE